MVNLEAVWVDKEDYLAILDPNISKNIRWQLEYARMFHRISDNSKILALTGLKQKELMPLKDGLKMKLEIFLKAILRQIILLANVWMSICRSMDYKERI